MASRRRLEAGVAAAGVVLFVAITGAIACGETISDPSRSDDCSAVNLDTDSKNCGTCGKACNPTESCVDRACLSNNDPRVDSSLYVDASKTEVTGCTRDKPCNSIRAALIEATNRDLKNGQEIRVCKGTYRETDLELNRTLSIRGGFNCSTWIRDEKVLSPTFDATNESRVENADRAASPVTLRVRGGNVPLSAIIDGLHIVGDGDAPGGSAIRVSEGAAPTIADNIIEAAGSSVVAPDVTSGITVLNGAAEIRGCRISNPAARGDFVGIYLYEATANVHDNTIDGGTGPGQLLGIWLNKGTASGDHAIRSNRISWTSGVGTTVGIFVSGANNVDILGNIIDQGTLSCPAGALCGSLGVSILEATGNISINGNRIRSGESATRADYLGGIRVAVEKAFEVANNMIHTGNLTGRADILNTAGIAIASPTPTSPPTIGPGRIVHNTIAIHDSGPPPPAPESNRARGVQVLFLARNVAVENNLFVGTVGAASSAIWTQPSSILASVSNNAFINTKFVYDSPPNQHGSLPALQSLTPAGTTVQGNARINTAESCGPTADCVAMCAEAAKCANEYLKPWTLPHGADDVLTSGYQHATALCALIEGAKDLNPPVARDHFNAPRSSKASIGAAELDVAPCK